MAIGLIKMTQFLRQFEDLTLVYLNDFGEV